MRLLPLLFLITTFFMSHHSYGAACPVSSTSTATGASNGSNCTVTGTASTIQLNFITGFSDATGISAVGGNNGTTVGAQRKLSFIKAAEILADQIQSSQTIIVDSDFSALSCNASSATLGSAGASTNLAYNAPAPTGMLAQTFYPIGLINAIRSMDVDGSQSDVNAQFNSNIGNVGCLQSSNGWYYGFDAPPSNYIGFTTVLLHEMTHGLGFASLTNATSGAKPSGTLDDIFSNFLYSLAADADWMAANTSDAERAASAVSGTGLLWNGSNVNTQAIGQLTAGYHDADSSSTFNAGDRVQMYAPNPVESGSSVSHFNTAASPNELMEPQYTEGQMDLGLALYLLQDIGWSVTPPAASNNAPTITAVDQSTNEDVVKVVDMSSWANDADGDSLTFSLTSCPANISCSVSGSNITLTPAANYNASTNTVTVQVSDGSATASDSFNLNVVAQNDAPTLSGVPNQIVKDGQSKDIDLSVYASDVDGDSLTFNDTACGANLTCSFPSTNVIRVAASGGVGTTVSVTVEADDGNGGTNSDTFDVTISSATPSTTVNVGGTSHNDGDTFTLPLGSTQIDVNNGTGAYTYSLDFNSNDVSSLITTNANGLIIGLPASGEFAGDYTLTITDTGDGDVITLTIKRPLRLTWTATSILNGDTAQTLKIEGGAAGTNYSLQQSGSADLIFRDTSDNAVTSMVAANDAASFNAAVLKLDSQVVSAISSMNVTVQSTYDDVVESGVKVYPATTHSFTVSDTAGSAISSATAQLNGGEALLSDLNLNLNYNADNNGQFTVLLPDTSVLSAGSSFAMIVSATGYNSENLTLDSNQATHNVTLTENANGITLTGSISALGSQDFKVNSPTVTITFADSSSENVAVTVSTISQASFTFDVDLNLKSLSSMSVSQSDSLGVNVDLSLVTQNQTFNILLERNVAVVTSSPTDIGGSGGGGGSLSWLMLLMLSGLFIRYQSKQSYRAN